MSPFEFSEIKLQMGRAATCAHDGQMMVVRSTGGWPDDHETSVGPCMKCGAIIRVVDFMHGSDREPEVDVLTPDEIATLQREYEAS